MLVYDIMEYKLPLFLAFSFILIFLLRLSNRKSSNLPPGPKPLPIVGNLFHLTNNPHHSLTNLSKIYGPLMSLKLGSITTIVVSSVDVAKQVFQVHDKSFSGRIIPDSLRAMDHHKYSLVWMPASAQWRNLRKILAVQLLAKQRLDATQRLRQNKVAELLGYVGECCEKGLPVEIGRAAFTTSLNFLSNTFFSLDLASYSSASSQEFKDIANSLMECLGKPNPSDFFPILTYFDPVGIRRKTAGYTAKMLLVFDDIIGKTLSCDPSSPQLDDVLGTLLKTSKEDGSALSLVEIKHLLLELIIAGTETTSSTTEWAITELLRNPTELAKVQAEMERVFGKDMLVQESDITRLPYLQAVVKETFRLHPPGPFLVPRKAENDVNFCGYFIPKNSQLLVNVWAIGRDPCIWENPEMFRPERFLGSEIDVKGQDFELIPFGAGRRICPGLPLGNRMLHFMLAALLQSYNWKLEGGMKKEDIDMTDKVGISLHKAEPLLAVPLPK